MIKLALDDGRELGIAPVEPHEAMNIAEGCRDLSGVRQWWQTAMAVAAIRTIDGIPLPAPTHEKHVEGLVARFSRADLAAIAGAKFPADDRPAPILDLAQLAPVETLRLWAAIGELETIPGWVAPAHIAAQVRKIDGEAVAFPTTKAEIKALVERLGVAGMTLASAFLVAHVNAARTAATDKQAAAKN